MAEADKSAGHPDEEAHPANAEERYTNYGLVNDLRDVNVFSQRLDTWYYTTFQQVGELTLGEGGIHAHTGAADFLAAQLRYFAHAFAGLARLRPGLQLGCRQPPGSVRQVAPYVETTGDADVLERLRADIAPLGDGWVVHLGARLDVRVVLRRADGEIAEQWFYNAGNLDLDVRRVRELIQRAPDTGFTEWVAWLEFEPRSVFQRDNSALLAEARARWKALRARQPDITWDNTDESPDPLVVTLVEPPSGTPADNQELYERNAPRLRAAVAAWEQAVGSQFQWAVSLEG